MPSAASPNPSLPTVVLPVCNALPALDACLAALARTLPAGASLRLVDDASDDPQVEPMARGWCARSGMDARYVRLPARVGSLRALQSVIDPRAAQAAGVADEDVVAGDVVVLAADAVPAGDWLRLLAATAAADRAIGSLACWSNRDELAAFPQLREPNALPVGADRDAIAEAASSLDGDDIAPALPAATGACVYLRREAIAAAGGLDVDSFRGDAGLDDLCRRAEAMGWRHALCGRAYVARQDAPLPRDPDAGDDRARLFARWPDQQARLARAFMDDPLRALRARLQDRLDAQAARGPQRDLFA